MAPRPERCLWASDKHQAEEMESHSPRFPSPCPTPARPGKRGPCENTAGPQGRTCVPRGLKVLRSATLVPGSSVTPLALVIPLPLPKAAAHLAGLSAEQLQGPCVPCELGGPAALGCSQHVQETGADTGAVPL